ncbi:MAG: VWA domain-containing protein, partial [bacterium]
VALMLVTLALMVFALSRPQYGAVERPVQRKGVDFFIAIDVSKSMLAQDMTPNRLERAKEQFKSLLGRLEGDRVGIITFAGTAYVQCPLTLDYGIARTILETVDEKSVEVEGTALGEAIRVATDAFRRAGSESKVLLLLTDGEDQGSDPVEAAKAAAKDGVRIYSIGIGSTQGVPIPLPGGGYKEDAQQHKVSTKLDLVTLQKIAQATNGKTVKANPSGDLELDAIYNEVSQLQKSMLESRTYTIYEDRFQYVLLPALALLLLECLMGDRARNNSRPTKS